MVTRHEKTMPMYTNTPLYISYFKYFTFCVSGTSSVNCIGFTIVSCIVNKSLIKFIHYVY